MSVAIDDGNCALCGGLANFKCQRCFESYCSNNCQLTDWPKHKLMCFPIPPLIPKETVKMINKKAGTNYLSSTQECSEVIVKNENLIQPILQNRQLQDNIDNIRRTRIENIKINDQNRNISNGGNNNAISVEIHDNILTKIDNMDIKSASNMNNTENVLKKSYHSMHSFNNNNNECTNRDRLRTVNNVQSNTNVTYKPNINDRLNKCRDIHKIGNDNAEQIRPKMMENPGFKKDYGIINNNNTSPSFKPVIPEVPINNKSSQLNDNLISESMENINTCSRPWKIPFPFPENKTDFQVTVQFVDQNAKLIWLTDISLDNDATKLLKQINENIQHADKASTNDINIDNIVAAPFIDGLYYRAIILDKINPKNEVRLRLVDYGNDFEIDINKLKLPIPIMKNLNAYAFCCRYNKSVEIGKILNIRVIGQESEEIFKIEEIK